jgi:glycosyltransferase involved in cell wall biosynthesis
MAQPKLAIVTTHPIQYYAPIFRALAQSGSIDLRVFYTWSQAVGSIPDPGFGIPVQWDVPLLTGYAYDFVPNVAKRPGTDHFGGLKNPTLTGKIENWGASAVLIYGWNSHSHLQALRYFKGRIPVLFRGDSTLLDQFSWWRTALRRTFLRWVYSHVDTAIAVGTNNAEYFAWCGIPSDRIAFAPHSVDTARFVANGTVHDALAAEWRRKLRIDANQVVFLYAGKLQKKKDPAGLLAAFEALSGSAHLIFVGSGELAEELQLRAANCPNVHFIPFQNQSLMPTVYRVGDVFVLPSVGPGETWGLALNEAMASGRAIIASSSVGGARDLVRSGENGWIFEAGDKQSLREVLRCALERERGGLSEMGKAAQALSVIWSTEESAQCIGHAVLECRTRR